MIASENPDWVAQHEAASAHVLAYEDALQSQIDDHMREGKLFEAGLIAFEHSDLLAMLRQSPAARQVAEFAILLTQRDMELAIVALDMLMEDAPFDPSVHILEAKDVLRNAMEERGYAPRWLVRQLGMAYLGDAPDRLLSQEKKWTTYTGGGLASRYLRKVWTRKATISVEDYEVTIELQTAKDYDQRAFRPGFEKKEKWEAREILRLYDGVTFFEDLGVDESSEASATAMAERLLELPDEPLYVDNTRPVAPSMPTTQERLAQLEAEEQRWMKHAHRNDVSDMVKDALKAIRSERSKLLQ